MLKARGFVDVDSVDRSAKIDFDAFTIDLISALIASERVEQESMKGATLCSDMASYTEGAGSSTEQQMPITCSKSASAHFGSLSWSIRQQAAMTCSSQSIC